MSQKKNTSFMDEIQEKYEIKGMRYTPLYYAEAGMILSLEWIWERPRPECPLCGARPIVHEYKKTIKFGALNGVPVTFEMNHSRYLCKSYGITFMDQFDYLPEQRGITSDAENYIISKLGALTYTELSVDLGVCVQTIANRAREFGAMEREQQLKGHYRYLSMDEVFITRDQEGEAVYYWLLNDNSLSWKSNNIRIDIGRNKEDVIRRLLELEHPERVETVSIDMWKPYRDAVLEALPQAAVVIDPFHVIQHAQKAMESIRKKVDVAPSLKASMKKDAGLFLKSLFKLTDDKLDRLELYLKADTDIKNAYFIVQELSGLYHLRDYEAALNYLARLETEVLWSGIKEMVDVLHTVQN